MIVSYQLTPKESKLRREALALTVCLLIAAIAMGFVGMQDFTSTVCTPSSNGFCAPGQGLPTPSQCAIAPDGSAYICKDQSYLFTLYIAFAISGIILALIVSISYYVCRPPENLPVAAAAVINMPMSPSASVAQVPQPVQMYPVLVQHLQSSSSGLSSNGPSNYH